MLTICSHRVPSSYWEISRLLSFIWAIEWFTGVLWHSIISVDAHLTWPRTLCQIYAKRLAPPLSMASISAGLHDSLPNLFGSSVRSKNSPSFGFGEKCDFVDCDREFSGPCVFANCSRYCLKDVGREEEGEAGWTRGVWSIDSGTVRLPIKWMRGVRARRMRVAFILYGNRWCILELEGYPFVDTPRRYSIDPVADNAILVCILDQFSNWLERMVQGDFDSSDNKSVWDRSSQLG